MNEVWVIAKRELGSYFNSLVAYVLLILFLGFTGFFTWLAGSDVFFRKQADLYVFFNIAMWSLFFFIPALTMRQIAEEKKAGTMELLLTKPVSDMQLVVSKYLACMLLVAIALLFTLPYYFTIASVGDMDHGATISGYLGLLLMSSAYVAIGIFASSLTNNQIVALLLAYTIGIFFQFLFSVISSGLTGWLGGLMSDLSMTTHVESITRGVIDSKDLVYFLSITLLGLLLAEVIIKKRT